ncbi:hypothetical protein [Nodosilinea nodulosa]|uniref:hypothetical protein n=1 Tax=Nodosilinea nodulosa TaxID=416001 RepID=UPI0012D73061|nr:hypothetical protein [Nodosilinea nodulosa]
MAQSLPNQSTSVAEKNRYHWQPSPEEHKLYRSSNKRSRSRGIVLSRQGWEKLRQAGVLNDEFGDRYTYEQLGEQSHLDERTVSRLLSCEVKVDKSTLKTFFNTFDLSLEAGDYASPIAIRNDS